MAVMLVIVIAIIGLIAFLKVRSVQKGMAMFAQMMPPPTAVSTVKVQPEKWEPSLKAVGSLRAVQGVTVSTDMAGIVSKISFESGTQVKQGDMLVQMDTTQEDAQILVSEARRDLATQELARKKDLLTKRTISQSEFDIAESELRQATASVAEMKAMTARKRIVAPFDGVIGIRQVNLGQYLNPGAAIAPLQSLDPIYIDFALPQQYLMQVEPGRKIRAHAAGTQQPVEGEISAVDAQVDEASRNITVRATVKNSEHKLRPGMYVDVEVLLPQNAEVLALPATAVSYALSGDSVFVVVDGKDPQSGKEVKVVEQRFVKLGEKRGDRVSVTSGVKAGDEVVSGGVFRLRPGAPVNPTNSVQPANELTPHPADT